MFICLAGESPPATPLSALILRLVQYHDDHDDHHRDDDENDHGDDDDEVVSCPTR